jgi:hypothetical protein
MLCYADAMQVRAELKHRSCWNTCLEAGMAFSSRRVEGSERRQASTPEVRRYPCLHLSALALQRFAFPLAVCQRLGSQVKALMIYKLYFVHFPSWRTSCELQLRPSYSRVACICVDSCASIQQAQWKCFEGPRRPSAVGGALFLDDFASLEVTVFCSLMIVAKWTHSLEQ